MGMNNSIEKAIKIAHKTGDRLILVDTVKDTAMVMMSLEKYEEMLVDSNENLGLTDGNMIDKINRDIAVAKNVDEGVDNYDSFTLNSESEVDDEVEELEDDFDEEDDCEMDEELDSFNRYEEDDKGVRKRKNWRIPRERKKVVLSGDDEVDDDKQYLEEIPF